MKPLSTIEIQTTRGPKEKVQAEILPGGLFALHSQWALNHTHDWHQWRVTHLPTGYVAGDFGYKPEARKYVKALMALDGIDWTSKDVEYLETRFEPVRELYRKFGERDK